LDEKFYDDAEYMYYKEGDSYIEEENEEEEDDDKDEDNEDEF